MDSSVLGFAIAAGLLAALNPCGFAMLPAYLSLVVLESGSDRRGGPVVRALTATVLMALGFVVVFSAFGLAVAPLASVLQRYLPVVTVVIGVVMVGLGGWLASGREITLLLPRSGGGAPTTALGSMFGYGVAYAIASLSCTVGPFLAVTTAALESGSVLGVATGYLGYALGMALVVGVLALIVALLGQGAAAHARRVLPYVQRLSGLLLVIVGLYVAYYGVYELRQDFGGTTGSDPVIDAAGVIQQTVSNWVDALGVWPFAVALVVLVLGATVVGFARRRRSTRQRPRDDRPAPSEPRGG